MNPVLYGRRMLGSLDAVNGGCIPAPPAGLLASTSNDSRKVAKRDAAMSGLA